MLLLVAAHHPSETSARGPWTPSLCYSSFDRNCFHVQHRGLICSLHRKSKRVDVPGGCALPLLIFLCEFKAEGALSNGEHYSGRSLPSLRANMPVTREAFGICRELGALFEGTTACNPALIMLRRFRGARVRFALLTSESWSVSDEWQSATVASPCAASES